MIRVAAAAAIALAAGSAFADVRLNEMLINVPGGDDNGQEFIELKGTPGMSLAGYSLLMIEGDGTGAVTIDQALSLGSFSIGGNGLFLWRDSAAVIDADLAPGVQGPDALTTVNVADFNPDIENGSNTYVLVTGFTGAVGADLDTNNDGVLDGVLPWTSVASAIALIENDGAANFGYAAALGGVNFGPNADFNADAFVFDSGTWFGMDTLGPNPGGPYTYDAARMLPFAADGVLTPGRENIIPAPGTLSLLAVAGLASRRRRR